MVLGLETSHSTLYASSKRSFTAGGRHVISRLFSSPHLMMVELTNRCNLKCKMCGIWAERPCVNLSIDDYDALLQQRTVQSLRVVALTGGEPFLLKDLPTYYRLARTHLPRAHINISTNGQCTAPTMAFLENADIAATSMTISYDGITSHDTVRGVKGSAERLLKTARKVRAAYPKLHLSLKQTVTNDNYTELYDTARQCQELGIPFRFKTLEKLVCHQSRSPSEIDGPSYSDAAVEAITEQARKILKLRIETNRKYIKQLIAHHNGALVQCNCSVRTLFISMIGEVFLCRKKPAIGNIRNHPLDDIWQSTQKRERVGDMRICAGDPLSLSFINQ